MALLPLFSANMAQEQCGTPCWTDVMNTDQQFTSPPNILSGNYYSLGQGIVVAGATNISYTEITPSPSTLAFPTNVTSLPAEGGPGPCGTVGKAVSYMASNPGSGIKGVGFQGTFNAPLGGVPLTYTPNNNLWEAVFFNENTCYNGGREYGFELAGSVSGIYAYYGTNENTPSVAHINLSLAGVSPQVSYYFEMYPIGNSSWCGFHVDVIKSDFSSQPINNDYWVDPSVTDADSQFCAVMTSATGETGYVSAGIEADPGVSGWLPSSSSLNLHLERVFVGK